MLEFTALLEDVTDGNMFVELGIIACSMNVASDAEFDNWLNSTRLQAAF